MRYLECEVGLTNQFEQQECHQLHSFLHSEKELNTYLKQKANLATKL